MKKNTLLLLSICIFSLGQAQTLTTVKSFHLSNHWNHQQTQQVIEYNNQLFFNGFDTTNGFELWVSDGTDTGTHLFLDIRTGTGDNVGSGNSSLPGFFCKSNGLLFFTAHGDSTVYRQLWVTDGTVSGTHMVKLLQDCCGGPEIKELIEYNNKLYFSGIGSNGLNTQGNHGLWKSDGTASGTQLVKEVLFMKPIVYNGKLFFGPRALWTSDGTTNGTIIVKDLMPNIYAVVPGFQVFNNMLYFQGKNSGQNFEPWTSDGTTIGTNMLKEIDPSLSVGSSPQYFTESNGKLFFSAADTVTAQPALWASDGTNQGTYSVLPNTKRPTAFKSFNNNLYFGSYDYSTQSRAFWKTDGTANGSLQLNTNIQPVGNYIEYNGKLYFIATNGNQGLIFNTTDNEHWVTDGTTTGTHLLSSSYNALDSEFGDKTSNYIQFGGSLYFFDHKSGLNTLMKFNSNAVTSVTSIPENDKINIYPNPSNSVFTIEMKSYLIDKISIKDLTGKIVMEKRNSNYVDLSQYTRGYYILNVFTKKGKRHTSPILLKK